MSVKGVYLVGGLRFHQTFEAFLEGLEAALQGGIRIFQLRVKNELNDRDQLELSRRVRILTKKYNCLYFVNDRPDLAYLSEADGLHLGPADITAKEARKIVGTMIIGKSSHSFEEAMKESQDDIDYLSVGPVYETDCKEVSDQIVGIELVKKVQAKVQVPIVAIGGITLENLPTVLSTGISCFGVIRGIMGASDIQASANDYVTCFEKHVQCNTTAHV
ncbi:MAG: thiamine-phosphate pyrophosphorylase [bacterium]|jgi:thiamine-phosphate pyrophosphorylase